MARSHLHRHSTLASSLIFPDLFDTLPVLPRLFPVSLRALVSFCAQTTVYFALNVVAVSKGLPEEAAGVTLIEGSHDFFAVYLYAADREFSIP